ncbi:MULTISPECIES: hypothetical protein [unclassified Rhodococcus (in: high G+C Gram-positive bacteria)]|uniref:hypothetical protein n=1 Tax=unclassified Rhodococcus (in: high G+C Gram-positive bacteria) TaxID=192944 RepID=UPI0003A6F488|nr:MULTISPECIES: hypothetical protein [unclassified Rhodococcus (in: high G+C Gram-positive bacteria)]
MNLHSILRRPGSGVPLLESARMSGSPRKWPSEKLERLLTAQEIDLIRRGQV